MTSDFALSVPSELESASRLKTVQFLITQRPWLDLYGKRVRPVAPFGSTSSKPFVDPALLHRCLPDELLFEVFARMSPYSLGRAACVCRKWRYTIRNPVFWRNVCLKAWQTDGQTEVLNRSLGNLLRCLVRDYAKSWPSILDIAEFAYNSSVNRTIGCMPFEALLGIPPKRPLDLVPLPPQARENIAADEFLRHITEVHTDVRRRIAFSSEVYKATADRHRRCVEFQPGDMVLVRVNPERFQYGINSKLHPRKIGPYKILKRIGPNVYVLDLPNDMRISNVFNVADLYLYTGHHSDEGDSEHMLKLPHFKVPTDEVVDAILDDAYKTTQHWTGYHTFLVRWKGCPHHESTWIHADDLKRLDPDLYDSYMAYSHSSETNVSKPGRVDVERPYHRRRNNTERVQDGLYVSRNTYIRTGVAEWKVTNPVHLVCYFRYIRFFPSGRFLYKNSSQKVKDVVKFMNFRASKAECVFSGRYTLSDEKVEAALLYPGLRPTVLRIRLRLRGTVAGANNRMDLLSLVTSGVNDNEINGQNNDDMLGVVEGWEDDETHSDVPAVSHKRGLTPFVFVPFEEVETSVLNLPVDKMDYYVTG